MITLDPPLLPLADLRSIEANEKIANDRRRKKLLLFLSDLNVLFELIKRLEEEDRTIKSLSSKNSLLGISAETFRRWSQGSLPPLKNVSAGLNDLIANVHKLGTRLRKQGFEHMAEQAGLVAERIAVFKVDLEDRRQAKKIYDTGLDLGMTIQQTQKALDIAMYESTVLLKPYSSETEAETIFSKFGGIYILWFYRISNGRQIFMRCALSVRYALTVDAKSFVRVKLNLPMLYPNENDKRDAAINGRTNPYHEYDGFLDAKADRVFFVFEKRSTDDDYVFLITDRTNSAESTGTYLTTDQAVDKPIFANFALLQRIATNRDIAQVSPKDDPAKEFMWKVPRVFPEPIEGEQEAPDDHPDYDHSFKRASELAGKFGLKRLASSSKLRGPGSGSGF